MFLRFLFVVLCLFVGSPVLGGAANSDDFDITSLDRKAVIKLQELTRYGIPLGASSGNTLVVRPIYCLSNNSVSKFADWVAYRLDIESITGRSIKKRNWKSDPDLKESETLEPNDYKEAHSKLGTDRGHQAPLASFKGTAFWYQTNYLSNITPQRSTLNRGPWKHLEEKVRELAARRPVYVITGPLFERQMFRLPNANEDHRIPSGYWKILAVENYGSQPLAVMGFIFDQDTSSRAKIAEHVVSIDEIEKRTGLDFFWELPDKQEEAIESRSSILISFD